MARPTRPTILPEWARTGTRTAPTSGKQDTGWIASDEPPAEEMNWLQGGAGDWVTWLEATIDEDSSNFAIFDAATQAGGTNVAAVRGLGKGTGAGVSGLGGSTDGPGVRGTGGATNGNGVEGVGTGSGDGGSFDGGATGYGVVGNTAYQEGYGGIFTNTNTTAPVGIAAGVLGDGVKFGVYGRNNVGTGEDAFAVYGDANNSRRSVGVYGAGGQAASAVLAENAAGVYGDANSVQPNDAYGVVARGDIGSNPPRRSALRAVPQLAAPSKGQVGDMYVTTAGVLKICTVAGDSNPTAPTWVSVGTQT